MKKPSLKAIICAALLLFIIFAAGIAYVVAKSGISVFTVSSVLVALSGIGCLISVRVDISAKSNKNYSVLGLSFIIYSIAILIAEIMGGLPAAFIAFCIGAILFCLYIELSRFITIIKCNKCIDAVFEKCKAQSSRGISYYFPIFKYNYNNSSYISTSKQAFGKAFIKRNYEKGKMYQIFIDPRDPESLIVKRRLIFSDFAVIAVIAIVIFLMILAISSNLYS